MTTTPKPFTPNASMSTRAFLEAVSSAGRHELRFVLGGDLLVAAGYHVTEIKALAYHAVDCGGQVTRWRETHVQLWNPEEPEEGGFMRADKFLSIYRRVARSVPIDDEAEIRFEYGNRHYPTAHYHVAELEPQQDRLLVRLCAPFVTCKARDRHLQRESCCGVPASSGAAGLAQAAPAHRSCC